MTLPLSHPLLQGKGMKGDASFVVVLYITGPNAQQEMKTASNVALKVTLQRCVGWGKNALNLTNLTKGQQLSCSHLTKGQQLSCSHLTKGQQMPCSPCPFARSLLLAPEASHKHL